MKNLDVKNASEKAEMSLDQKITISNLSDPVSLEKSGIAPLSYILHKNLPLSPLS